MILSEVTKAFKGVTLTEGQHILICKCDFVAPFGERKLNSFIMICSRHRSGVNNKLLYDGCPDCETVWYPILYRGDILQCEYEFTHSRGRWSGSIYADVFNMLMLDYNDIEMYDKSPLTRSIINTDMDVYILYNPYTNYVIQRTI